MSTIRIGVDSLARLGGTTADHCRVQTPPAPAVWYPSVTTCRTGFACRSRFWRCGTRDRLLLIGVVTGVICALLVGVAAAEAKGAGSTKQRAAGPCGVPAGTLARRSAHALVVRQAVRDGTERVRYWGCLETVGAPVLLGVEDDEFFMLVDKFAFAGRYVAAVESGCLAECAEPWIKLFDLRARRQVRYIARNTSDYEGIAKVLVGTRGGVAVLEQERARRIRVWRRGRPSVTVARGSYRALRLGDFRVNGNLLHWRQDGRSRSYRM